jgi:hypothetical protein
VAVGRPAVEGNGVTIPDWPPKDWRAWFALVASVLGAAVLTGLLAWIIGLFGRWGSAAPLANIDYGLLGIIGLVLLALGYAINRRSFKGSIGPASFETSGGDDAIREGETVTLTREN